MTIETIVAIATPPGEGGIGIVRLSGPQALAIGKKLVRPRGGTWQAGSPRPRYLHYGFVYSPRSGAPIDECLCVAMPGPHSFTAEDVFEIQAHGGRVVLEEIVQACLEAGARLARPGEFTERAFQNGRIDLAQAEAILDVIRAKTREGKKIALQQLTGKLSAALRALRTTLLNSLIEIEATIDFPEDEIPEVDREELYTTLAGVAKEIENLLAGARQGQIYRDGLQVALVGKPNVGKSSLLNKLLREERAIVTEIPGTTRDVIEAMADLGGIPVLFFDTAGIRETEDKIERLGIERTEKAIAAADLVLFLLDASRPLGHEDNTISKLLSGKRTIVILNKVDLRQEITLEMATTLVPGAPVLSLSVFTGEGLAELEKAIRASALGSEPLPEPPLVSNLRHVEALLRAQEAVARAQRGIKNGDPLDLVAIEMRAAVEALGEITGETLVEDVLAGIFSRFCLGK